jgi:putative MFS transporter
MTLGALITGFVGDKFGRRFTYQINLLIFGLASLAAAFAQDMNQLIACRFVQGLGLGAEIVVGYSTLTEFVPPKTRGRWLSMMAFLVVAGFPVTALARLSHHPGLGLASDVRHRRRRLADRLVSAQESSGVAALAGIAGPHRGGRSLMQAIEKEAAGGGTLPPPVVPAPVPQVAAHGHAEAAAAAAHDRRLLGADHDQHADLRLRDLPAAVLPAPGLTIANSLAYTLVLSAGSLVGCALGAYLSDAIGGAGASSAPRSSPSSPATSMPASTPASDPAIVLSVGFVLIVAIYVQTAILFGVYTPELFPTEIRLRANGICNTLGRGATVVSPFIVGA